MTKKSHRSRSLIILIITSFFSVLHAMDYDINYLLNEATCSDCAISQEYIKKYLQPPRSVYEYTVVCPEPACTWILCIREQEHVLHKSLAKHMKITHRK